MIHLKFHCTRKTEEPHLIPTIVFTTVRLRMEDSFVKGERVNSWWSSSSFISNILVVSCNSTITFYQFFTFKIIFVLLSYFTINFLFSAPKERVCHHRVDIRPDQLFNHVPVNPDWFKELGDIELGDTTCLGPILFEKKLVNERRKFISKKKLIENSKHQKNQGKAKESPLPDYYMQSLWVNMCLLCIWNKIIWS